MKPALFALLWSVYLPTHTVAEVLISEFLTSNLTGEFRDEDGDPSDWIELHNADDTPVNLAGYGLTDRPGVPLFTFPEVTMAPGSYLIVFASGKNRTEPGAPLHTSFQLSRGGEYLALTNSEGTVLSAFDPEYPGQENDRSYGIVGTDSSLYAFLDTPTPGEANQLPPPVIEGTNYSPQPADPNERLTITATVRKTGGEIDTVLLKSVIMFKAESSTEMKDDGVAPDEIAGDRVYTAQISNRSLFGPLFKPGEIVRWAVEATDIEGNTARFPRFATPDSEAYTGIVLAHEPIDTKLNVFHWFPQDAARAETDGGSRGGWYCKGEFYDNVFTRIRGGTARSWPKKSYKVEFPEDHHFKFDPNFPRVDEFNLNATYTDKSYTRAIMTTELHQDSGTPSPITFPLRVHQNGAFYSVALFVEQPDRDFLRRNGLDPDGAYYKANPGSTYTTASSFEKKTRQDEGKDDLNALLEGLKSKEEAYLFDHIDLPAQLNFMAGVAITQNIDDSDKNHFLYSDTNGSGEWFMTPWDLDLTFGPDALNTDIILADENHPGAANPNAVHPFIGSRQFPLHAGKTNELLDRLFVSKRTQEMYLRRLRTLHDQFLATDYFDTRLDELLNLFERDTILDNEIWGSRAHFGGRRESMAETVQRIKTEYLAPRRAFFERGGMVNIPASMPAQPPIKIEAVESAPVSGNQNEEYIQLVNPNAYAVDLSGWRLEGAVELTFRPGTVLGTGSLFSPGRNVMYVVKDAAAFRLRQNGPSGGKNLFVHGNYRGSLSNLGEEIRLIDDKAQLIASKTYEGSSTPWQEQLQITEIMANPSEDGVEFVELTNTGTSSLDLSHVRFTDGISFDFTSAPITTLAPGAFVLIASNQAAFEARYGTDLPLAGVFAEGTALNKTGETIKLEDPKNNTIAEFRYRTENPWPSALAGYSYVFSSGDPNNGENWHLSTAFGGTPNTHETITGGIDSTLLVQAFGSATPSGSLRLIHEDGITLYEIVYPKNSETDASFRLEQSSDLRTWSSMSVEPDFSDLTHVSYRIPSSEALGYLRIRVSAAR